MCGICGIAYEDRERVPDRAELSRMTDRLRLRGPDAQGLHLAPGIGLGHRRLSVIDLEGGAQPMSDPTGRWTICFNGEIYNFLDLRRQLLEGGSSFRTRSDTEVILNGYAMHGPSIVERLVGMFAFAIWDRVEDTLFLARDRLGVKPLCWAELPEGGIVFGSEVGAIEACASLEPELNREAIALFLSLGYIPGSSSAIEGVRRLPPAATLAWKRGGAPRLATYWDLAEVWKARSAAGRDGGRIEERFLSTLDRAVEDRLVSDVPLGAFLSGGLDSSTVTALMLRHKPEVETFSIGFAEPSYDESAWACRVATMLGTRHTGQVVLWDSPDLLLEVASRLDQPFADTSIIPTYVLCRMARARITVALSGDGGDELLAGYVTHGADSIRRRLGRFPAWLLRLTRAAAEALPDSRRKVNWVFKAKQFLRGARFSPCDAHASWRLLAHPDLVSAILSGGAPAGFDPFAPFREAYRQGDGLDPLDRFLLVDYKTWLADDILVKVDQASMAHGLEVRSPFLDHRLVEFCAGVPPRLKRHGGQGKLLLRRVARGLVPRCAGRRKRGFNAPVSQWIAGPWREIAGDALSPASIRSVGIVEPGPVARLMEEHARGRRDHGYLLFALLMLQLWMLAHREKESAPASRTALESRPLP